LPSDHIREALLFVPGVYGMLVLSALVTLVATLLSLGIIGGLIALVVQIAFSLGAERVPVPVGILFAIGIGGLIGVYASIKGVMSAIFPPPSLVPALSIQAHKHPQLKELINDLCHILNTDFPDAILLGAGPDFWVAQGKFRTFNGTVVGRVLCLSMPLLSLLSTTDLRAILAHEFAHFTGDDTVWSARVLPVYTGTATALGLMEAVDASGAREDSGNSSAAELPLIIPRMMLSSYLRRFHEINMSLSRIREFRADAIATYAVGASTFRAALVRVSVLGALFATTYFKIALELAMKGQYLTNGYDYFRSVVLSEPELYTQAATTLLHSGQVKDASHPSLAERLAALPQFEVEKVEDLRCASDLVSGPDELENQLATLYAAMLSARLGTLKA